MMACSLAWSTSVTKSFTCFCETRTDSTSRAARLMMAPAARAALMATLSMGCRLDDINCVGGEASAVDRGLVGRKSGGGQTGDAGGDNRRYFTCPARPSCKPQMLQRCPP